MSFISFPSISTSSLKGRVIVTPIQPFRSFPFAIIYVWEITRIGTPDPVMG